VVGARFAAGVRGPVRDRGGAAILRGLVIRGLGGVGLGCRGLPGVVVGALGWVLVLGVCCAGVLGAAGATPSRAQTTRACHPRVGAEGVAPFTVWYCQGDRTGEHKTAIVKRLLDAVWKRETRPEPNGLGPPITPEANGGRISVYVTAPDALVRFGRCPRGCEPVGGDFGFARPAAPFSRNRAGGPTSSGGIVINEQKGVTDATVIHEFFHVLQFAHNWVAVGSWVAETMATWAEHEYGAKDTSRVSRFFRDFQREPGVSLIHRPYGAYVWLLWLAQRTASDQAVFRLWSALEPAHSDKIDVIDRLVARFLGTLGLSWARDFKDFAVEDLNRDLSHAVTPNLFGRGPFGDPAAKLGLIPKWVRPPSTLTIGTRRTVMGSEDDKGVGNMNDLSAQYEHITAISAAVRAVKVTASRMKPWGDLVVLAHTRSGWRRQDLQDDSVSFCRRQHGQGVDQLYLIAANHRDLRGYRAGGGYTVTGKPTCS
jgi:hypothetical protein